MLRILPLLLSRHHWAHLTKSLPELQIRHLPLQHMDADSAKVQRRKAMLEAEHEDRTGLRREVQELLSSGTIPLSSTVARADRL